MVIEETFNFIAFLTNIRGSQLLIILLAILLLFGAKRLPELAKGLGKSIREFKKSVSGVEKDFREAMDSVEEEAQVKEAVATTEANVDKTSQNG